MSVIMDVAWQLLLTMLNHPSAKRMCVVQLQTAALLLIAAAAVLLPACGTAAAAATGNVGNPVRVNYYMEALCP
jgi:hypothetical protein